MYKRCWKLTSCLIILSLLMPYVVSADGQENGPELEVKAAQAVSGQNIVADIVMNRPKGLKAFEFMLHYDRNALEIADRDVAKGADVAGWMLEYKVNSANGTVRMAAVHVDGFKLDSQAAIARLTFKIKGSAGVKPFRVTDLKGFMDLNKAAVMSSQIGALTNQGVNWKASATVDGKIIQDVVIEDGNDKRTTIKITAPNSSGIVKLDLEEEAMRQIADSGKLLAVQTPVGSLEIDSPILGQLANSRVEMRIETMNGAGGKPARKIAILADRTEVKSFEGKLKILIPYAKPNSELNETIVAYRTADDSKKIVPQTVLSDGQVMMVANGTGTFEIGYAERTFSDTADHWSRSNIEFVAARELFIGVGDERFAPEQRVTRGMFVTVLGRMLGVGGGGSATEFQDVNADAYYAPYVAYASKHGIVNGVGGGKFAPDREITREEMAAIMIRFMEQATIESSAGNANPAFADQEQFSEWAADAVRELRAIGIVEGKPGNLFDPQGFVKRAEAAKMIRSLVEMAVR